ncbi:MAG: hypothetical protein FWG50_13375 [Kiritimatiellaeota bacterium]|nr:hypothetical protein [Kiritimatiellota bacterium]
MSFETIHEETFNALKKDAFLALNQVEVLLEDKGDINAQITLSLGKLGICAMVTMPGAKARSSNARLLTADADITVQVLENPTINRRRANMCTAGAAARRISAVLNLHRLPDGEVLVFEEVTSGVLEKAVLLFNVRMKTLTTLGEVSD